MTTNPTQLIEQLMGALLQCARLAEDLKKDCGMDPESPQALRNGLYMNISYVARAAITAARARLEHPTEPAPSMAGEPQEQGNADIYIAFGKTGENIRFWTANKSHASEWEYENGPLIAFHREPPPSYKDAKLAEMIMSDCGCSTNNTSLLDRIVQRIARSNDTNPQASEDFCYCNDDVSLQMVSGGGAPEGYLGKMTLRIGDQYRDFYTHPPPASDQGRGGDADQKSIQVRKV
jgi:hypothetical protein